MKKCFQVLIQAFRKISFLLLKLFIFLLIWAIFVAFYYINSDDPAVFRFLSESDILLFTVLETIVFWFLGRMKMQIVGWKRPARTIIIGIFAGLAWTLIPTAVLYLMGFISFTGPEYPDMLRVWILSMLSYTLWMELILHGYLYQVIKKELHVMPALVFSAVTFACIYDGESFGNGLPAALNLITMSLAMSFAMEYTGSLITPVIMQCIYNVTNGILLGTETLITFPHIMNAVYSDSDKVICSIVVTGANCILMAVFGVLWGRKRSMERKVNVD